MVANAATGASIFRHPIGSKIFLVAYFGVYLGDAPDVERSEDDSSRQVGDPFSSASLPRTVITWLSTEHLNDVHHDTAPHGSAPAIDQSRQHSRHGKMEEDACPQMILNVDINLLESLELLIPFAILVVFGYELGNLRDLPLGYYSDKDKIRQVVLVEEQVGNPVEHDVGI